MSAAWVSDADSRSAAVNGEGSVLVQAPAGSGKTTLLVQRFLRLLSRVNAPEEILALTFTRRAAQEMRERVIEALRVARQGERAAHINADTWDLAVSAAQNLARLQLDVEAQPGRLRIETIDAFNAWLAAQLPIAAGAAGLSVLPDARQCYVEAARRALAHEGSDVFGAAVERVLALDDQRWRALVKLIAEMLPSRDRWLPLLAGRLKAAAALNGAELASLRRRFDEDLRLLVGRVIQRAQQTLGGEILSALQTLLCRAANRNPHETLHLAPWREDASPLRDTVEDAVRWRALAEALLTASNKIRVRLTKAEGFPAKCEDKPVMGDILVQLSADPRYRHVLREIKVLPGFAYSDAQWDRVREVAQVLVLSAAQLDAVFREQGAVDFTAVSLAALRALGSSAAPSDLALKLDYRLQHILVDEFQDTSSAQLELLRLLTAGWQDGDGRSVFCVGDPMQSIYGFRQAEVRAFLELADQGIGDVHFDVQRLQSNFRSTPGLVAWINGCFARIMPGRDDRERGAIAFRPSSAAKAGAMNGVDLRAFGSAPLEAAGIAETLAQVREKHPDWSIAVLVRARTHARHLTLALRARGLAYRAVQIEPLQDRGLIRDLIMLTRALLHLGDRIAWLAILRAPWAGLTLADLMVLSRAALIWDALQDNERLAQLSAEGRARCERLREVLQQAFGQRSSVPLTRWIESTWLRLGGPGCVNSEADLHLAERAFTRLRELEERGLPDPAELNASFAELFADQGGEGRIEIMTIHKAKGLEFDMVVVPALQRHPAPNRGQLLLSHEFARAGRDGMVMAARPPVGGEAEKLFDFLRYQQRDAGTLEAQRLLYVACTRAKSRLLLSAAIETDEEPIEDTEAEVDARRPFMPRAGSLLALLWPTASSQFLADAALDSAAHKSSGGTDEALRGGPLWRLPQEWTPSLYLGEPGERPLPPENVTGEEWPEFDWASEIARRVGSLVHAQLQHLDPQLTSGEDIRAREPQFRRWLAAHGIPQERLSPAVERVVATLLSVLEDPRAHWILKRGYRDDLREHALSGQLLGEVVHAVFDRSFVDGGIRWVIDYKTSQHLGGGLAAFLDREVERYGPQMRRYALLAQKLGPEPVRLGLYFPLMKSWREWAG